MQNLWVFKANGASEYLRNDLSVAQWLDSRNQISAAISQIFSLSFVLWPRSPRRSPWGMLYQRQNKSAEIAEGRQIHEQHLDAYPIDTDTRTHRYAGQKEFSCTLFKSMHIIYEVLFKINRNISNIVMHIKK